MARDQALGIRLWLLVIAVLAIVAIPYTLEGFRVGDTLFQTRLKIPLIGLLIAALLMSNRQTYRIGGIIEGIFLCSLVASIGIMAAYSASIWGRPLIDAQLLGIDQALGYNWLSYARFCASHGRIFATLQFCYTGAYYLPAILAVVLYLNDERARFETFVLALMISVLITASIFLLWPATTAWTHLGQDHLASVTLSRLPTSSNSWIGELLRLRGGGSRIMNSAAGLVAFPSYHCVMALTYIWASWSINRFRVAVLAFSLLTIASAPIIGGHYVTDLLGGALVAFLGIVAAKGVHRSLRGLPLPMFKLPRLVPAFSFGGMATRIAFRHRAQHRPEI